MNNPRTLDGWQAYIETLHPRAIDLGLARVQQVQRRLGLDRPTFAVVTVAGTNGKGSSVAMLEAILTAAGYRVGAYTSPHLVVYNERVRSGAKAARDAELCSAFENVERVRDGVSLTYFEFGTLAALQIFQNEGIDIALLEVGLGGRLDAVNILDADVSLITSVGIDHTDWLGSDRESIGREKAGIFRTGRPAVCAEPAPPASIAAVATEVGAVLSSLHRDFGYTSEQGGWSWWGGGHTRTGLPYPAVRGQVQVRNAAGVLMVLERLATRFPVTEGHIRGGLQHAVLPGRFQILPGVPVRILDVAHNPEAVWALRRNIERQPIAGRTTAVCAMLRDKPMVEVLSIMAAVVDRWHVATLDVPRGARAEELHGLLQETAESVPVAMHPNPEAAYHAACAQATAADRIIVFGSFHTVGAIMQALTGC